MQPAEPMFDDLFDSVDKWGDDILSLLPPGVDVGSPVPSTKSNPSSTSAGCTTATGASDTDSSGDASSGMDGSGTPTLAGYTLDIPHVEPMSTADPLGDLIEVEEVGAPGSSSTNATPIVLPTHVTASGASPQAHPALVTPAGLTPTLAPASAPVPAPTLAPAPAPAATTPPANALKRPNSAVLPSLPAPENLVASFLPPGGVSSKRLKREERLRRNRESAQRSRQRAKAKAQIMEHEMSTLRSEVAAKDATIAGLQAENKALREQVDYLRNMVQASGGAAAAAAASAAPRPGNTNTAMTGGIIAMTIFFSFAVCFLPGSPAAGGLSQWFSGGSAMGPGASTQDMMYAAPTGMGRRGLLTEDARTLETPPLDINTDMDGTQGLPPVPHFWSPSAAVSFALYALGMHQVARTVLTHIACLLVTVLTVYFARQSVKGASLTSSSSSSASSGELLPVNKGPATTTSEEVSTSTQ